MEKLNDIDVVITFRESPFSIMRLLSTSTGHFRYVDHPNDIEYAILSHVWDLEVQTFQEVSELQYRLQAQQSSDFFLSPELSEKVRNFCRVARENGYEWVWMDTCCIDKTSSSELSEAVNSVYLWYSMAKVCYVHLADVPGEDRISSDSDEETLMPFRRSRWHTRGWTLPELIAPGDVRFFSNTWVEIGSKLDLVSVLEEITGVDSGLLASRKKLSDFSVACRMSWAAKRAATRLEDEAYCLLGIFGVNMPVLYGEGYNAFIRLQEEILKRIPDQTLLVWGTISPLPAVTSTPSSLPSMHSEDSIDLNFLYDPTPHLRKQPLAMSPSHFVQSRSVLALRPSDLHRRLGLDSNSPTDPHILTSSYSFQLTLPISPIPSPFPHGPTHLGFLACEAEDQGQGLIALLLRPGLMESPNSFVIGGRIPVTNGIGRRGSAREHRYARIAVLTREQVTEVTRRNPPQIVSISLPPSQYETTGRAAFPGLRHRHATRYSDDEAGTGDESDGTGYSDDEDPNGTGLGHGQDAQSGENGGETGGKEKESLEGPQVSIATLRSQWNMISQFVCLHAGLCAFIHIDTFTTWIQLVVFAGLHIALLAFTPDSIVKLAGYSRIPLVTGTSISIIGFAASMFLSSWVEDIRILQARLVPSFRRLSEANKLIFRVQTRF